MDLFALVARLTLDSSEYEKKLRDAEEGTSGMTSKWAMFGKVAKGVGVVTAAAVGAAAVGVGKLTKEAVSAYANYEQLAGGVKKLFGEEASKELMNYANNAYKTSGMSANQYMEQATSFSAALINSLGGDQVKAAQQADIAMKAMSDNVNTFGSDMQSVQYAYQGFAKQNYTMLDNLKLGYGGTKTEMERLIADANEYAAANGMAADLSIDSFSDIVTAIDLIQQKQGIAGTTAKEAASTIEGALNMTKSAWQNLVAGLANPDADLGALMDNLVIALVGENEGEGLLNQLTPAIERAMEGLGTVIEEAAPILAEELPKIIETVLPSLLSAATTLIAGLVQALPSLISVLVQQVPMIVETLVSAFLTLGGELISTGAELLNNLASGIRSGFEALWRNVVSWARKIPQAIKNGVGSLWSIGSNMIEGLWGGIKSKFDSVIAKVKALAAKLPDAVKKVLGISSPSKVFAEVGRWIPEGLALGIENNLRPIESAADAMVGATAITPTFGNTGLLGATEGEFGRLTAILQEWLPQLTNMDIVLDSGALVGELSRTIDSSLGARQKNRERGNA